MVGLANFTHMVDFVNVNLILTDMDARLTLYTYSASMMLSVCHSCIHKIGWYIEGKKKIMGSVTGIVLNFCIVILLSIMNEANGDYDYFQLVLQYQVNFCCSAEVQRPCQQIPNHRFTIHGLWPSNYSWTPPNNICPGNRFNAKAVRIIYMCMAYTYVKAV